MSNEIEYVLELTAKEAELLSTALLTAVRWSANPLGENAYNIWQALDGVGVKIDERYRHHAFASIEYTPG